jgi:SAM-dependent methyltransferase
MLPLYTERLSDIAAQAYRLSDRLCGPCRDLHALWPYIRLSRSSTGVEFEGSRLAQNLRTLIAEDYRDVLIAGSADTGLLTLVARAGIEYGVDIVVLDICETPLELCRRFAGEWSIPIRTLRKDLLDLDADQQFDLILVHGTLHFIAEAQRFTAVSRIWRALRREGRLALLFNTSQAVNIGADDKIHNEYADAVVSELKRQHIPLPDSEAMFRDRLSAHSRRRQLREGAFAAPSDVTLLLERAGFNVLDCTEIDIRLPSKMSDFVSRIAKRRFMLIAEPSGAI